MVKDMLRRVRLILLWAIIILPSVLLPQEFNVSADRTTVGENERFQIFFAFEGGDFNKLRNFRAPDFQGFRVLSGPNQSTSMQIINGSVSSSITYGYIVQSTAQGSFTLGSASVEFEGKTYTTKPLAINVIKGSGVGAGQPNETGGISNEEIGKNLFIIATADDRDVYQGEQVTVIYKLYNRLNISSPQISKLPVYSGFWAEELETAQNLSFNIEMYNGERFRSAILKKVALFPAKSGELTISPFELDIPVIIKRKSNNRRNIIDDFFDDPFFGRSETVQFKAKSNSIKVNVRALPMEGKPEDFSGAVGNFDISAKVDKESVNANDPVTLKMTISGTGNIKLLPNPEIDLPIGFEKYDPKTTENISNRGLISGSKNFEMLIVPRLSGIREIPAFTFSYFNPSKQKYIQLKAGPFMLDVKKVEGMAEFTQPGMTKEEVKLLSQDIRYIKTSTLELDKIDKKSGPGALFWSGIIIPALFLGIFLFYQKRQEKIKGNAVLLRYSKAEKKAKSLLKLAKASVGSDEKGKFYSILSEAFSGYFRDKLNIALSEFSVVKVCEELKKSGLNAETITNVRAVFEKCEFARFSPDSSDLSIENSVLESAERCIVETERMVKIRRVKK